MLRFLQRTLLYQRTSEAMHAYRVLKRAEHRSALKLKRAAVRARVLSEVQKAQIERTVLRMQTARANARVQSANAVADSYKKRGELVRQAVAARGLSIESDSASNLPEGVALREGSSAERAGELKERILTKAESLLPAREESGPGRRLAANILRESVQDVSLNDAEGEREMSARLIAGVAKQAGVDWEEMERLIEVAEQDDERRSALRSVVREAMGEKEHRQSGS